jgi:hypothetical protein
LQLSFFPVFLEFKTFARGPSELKVFTDDSRTDRGRGPATRADERIGRRQRDRLSAVQSERIEFLTARTVEIFRFPTTERVHFVSQTGALDVRRFVVEFYVERVLVTVISEWVVREVQTFRLCGYLVGRLIGKLKRRREDY